MRTTTAARAPAGPSRVLVWDGCVNVRDLGGLPLEGGGETRFGVAVRADSIRRLTDAGWRALADYGVRLAVDLRGDEELADDPPEGTTGPQAGRIPSGHAGIEIQRQPMPGHTLPVAWQWPSMLEAYLGLLVAFRPQLAATVRAVARSDSPVVVHCVGGRDRTGLACALMLRLAGVPLEAIAADHALSDESWAPYTEQWFAEAPDEWERERRKRVSAPAGDTMARVLEQVDARAYLLEGGVSSADLDRLVVKLRPWS